MVTIGPIAMQVKCFSILWCGVVEATSYTVLWLSGTIEVILIRTTPHNLIMVTAGFNSWRQESVNSGQDRNSGKTFHMTFRTPEL